MLIFLHGSDAYRLKQAKEEFIGRYKTKYSSGMNLFSVDLSESAGLDTLENALKSSSFFNEHKLIVCQNIFAKKPVSELLLKYLKEYHLAEDTDITLMVIGAMENKEPAARNKELLKLLNDKKNIVQEIEPLQGEKLFEWIKKEFRARGCSIEPDAARKLVDIVGTDTWSIINEVNKLALYGKDRVTSGDVLNLVNARIDLNIFDLIDALGNNDRRKSVELLYKELKTGRDPYYILTMAIYQFRNILAVKDLKQRGLSEAEIGRKTKFHPFAVKKAMKSPFETGRAVKIYNRLLELDTNFKTGQVNLEDYLYNLALDPITG